MKNSFSSFSSKMCIFVVGSLWLGNILAGTLTVNNQLTDKGSTGSLNIVLIQKQCTESTYDPCSNQTTLSKASVTPGNKGYLSYYSSGWPAKYTFGVIVNAAGTEICGEYWSNDNETWNIKGNASSPICQKN